MNILQRHLFSDSDMCTTYSVNVSAGICFTEHINILLFLSNTLNDKIFNTKSFIPVFLRMGLNKFCLLLWTTISAELK